jgi:hypothetical protein
MLHREEHLPPSDEPPIALAELRAEGLELGRGSDPEMPSPTPC